MTRAILAALLTATTAILLTNQGCKSTGVGDPCTPEQEYDPLFSGFSEKEVNVESKSFQCQTRLCLVNHFRGRVSCPYGQDSQGNPPANVPGTALGQAGCAVPGNDPQKPVDQLSASESEQLAANRIKPALPDPLGACVASQCEDRAADKAVYCSCRCANVDGKTDDGAVYCECPESFQCEQLVSSIGGTNEGLTGGYCVKSGTTFNSNSNCASSLDVNDPRKCVQ
ncbi:MAG: hypothetical protein EOP08_14350 [Proteobacteria bacterium]|nr:MAG: hypothetical protein EOP08_14350 [Pseudomonadota bacterium]